MMKFKKHLIIIGFIALLSTVWYLSSRKYVSVSFYHWNTEFNLRVSERKLLENAESDKIYIRLFDLDIDNNTGQILPKAKVNFISNIPENIDLIPVIYIAQKCFKNNSTSSLEKLAKKTIELAKTLVPSNHLNWKEFQVDCDWTENNKEKYFEFLKQLKANLPNQTLLTCTIRLHQIKYPEKTGIPPVKKGILMFYNIGNVQKFTNVNSIYDFETASNYLKRLKDYPIKLDYALATFSWGLHYRIGKIQSILTEESLRKLDSCKLFIQSDNKYVCTMSGIFEGDYFIKGDLIKIEKSGISELNLAAKQLKEHIKEKEIKLILYQIKSTELNNYGSSENKNLQSIFN